MLSLVITQMGDRLWTGERGAYTGSAGPTSHAWGGFHEKNRPRVILFPNGSHINRATTATMHIAIHHLARVVQEARPFTQQSNCFASFSSLFNVFWCYYSCLWWIIQTVFRLHPWCKRGSQSRCKQSTLGQSCELEVDRDAKRRRGWWSKSRTENSNFPLVDIYNLKNNILLSLLMDNISSSETNSGSF